MCFFCPEKLNSKNLLSFLNHCFSFPQWAQTHPHRYQLAFLTPRLLTEDLCLSTQTQSPLPEELPHTTGVRQGTNVESQMHEKTFLLLLAPSPAWPRHSWEGVRCSFSHKQQFKAVDRWSALRRYQTAQANLAFFAT